jgi:uncharacterized membrane protein YfcA
MAIKNFFSKFLLRIKKDNERGAREHVLEDLFYDFNRSRVQIYKMNFVRGIFFGLGSVIGGTIVVAVLAWILSFFVDLPGVGNSIQQVQHSIESSKQK